MIRGENIVPPADRLELQLKTEKLTYWKEFLFAKSIRRKWRADFFIFQPYPQQISLTERTQRGILVEVEGGTWVGGRHVSGKGFENDCIKYNSAVLLGYRLLRFTPKMIDGGIALTAIKQALRIQEKGNENNHL